MKEYNILLVFTIDRHTSTYVSPFPDGNFFRIKSIEVDINHNTLENWNPNCQTTKLKQFIIKVMSLHNLVLFSFNIYFFALKMNVETKKRVRKKAKKRLTQRRYLENWVKALPCSNKLIELIYQNNFLFCFVFFFTFLVSLHLLFQFSSLFYS